MLKIYGALNSRASRIVWLDLELGLEAEHVPVIQASRLNDPAAPDAPLNTASPIYRKIVPHGQIPAIDDGGLVLTESLAINLHLARKAPTHPVAPQTPDEESLATMWSLWAATECEPPGIALIVNLAIRTAKDRDARAVETALAALDAPLRRLTHALDAGGGYLVGGRFTVADLNAAEVLRYAQPAASLFEAHPVVADWLALCQARPAFRQMMERRSAEYLPPGWRAAYRPGGPAELPR